MNKSYNLLKRLLPKILLTTILVSFSFPISAFATAKTVQYNQTVTLSTPTAGTNAFSWQLKSKDGTVTNLGTGNVVTNNYNHSCYSYSSSQKCPGTMYKTYSKTSNKHWWTCPTCGYESPDSPGSGSMTQYTDCQQYKKVTRYKCSYCGGDWASNQTGACTFHNYSDSFDLAIDNYTKYQNAAVYCYNNGTLLAQYELTIDPNSTTPKITSKLTDVSVIEGENKPFRCSATIPSGNGDVKWSYFFDNIPVKIDGGEIKDSYAFESSIPQSGYVSKINHRYYFYEGQIYSNLEFSRLDITDEEKSKAKVFDIIQTDTGIGTGNIETELLVKNAPVEISGSFRVNCEILSGIEGVSNTIVLPDGETAHLFVIANDFVNMDTTLLNSSYNVGKVLNPTNKTQFVNIIRYLNNTSAAYSGKEIKFLDVDALKEAGLFVGEATEANLQSFIDGTAIDVDAYDPEKTNQSKREIVDEDNNVTGYEYYQSGFTCSDDLFKDGLILNDGDYTYSEYKVQYGKNKLFVILINTRDISKSIVKELADFNGIDLEGPSLTDIKANWVSSGNSYDIFKNNPINPNIGEDSNFPLRLSFTAKDNLTKGADLTYQWYKLTESDKTPITNGFGIEEIDEYEARIYLDLTADENNNGFYICEVFDASVNSTGSIGNSTTTEPIEIFAWDITPPVASVVVTPDENQYSEYKEIFITEATDNFGLANEPFAIVKTKAGEEADLSSCSWSNQNHYTIDENGLYHVFVKDAAGNIFEYKDTSGNAIALSTIDHKAPSILAVEIKPTTDDGTLTGKPSEFYIDSEGNEIRVTDENRDNIPEDAEVLQYVTIEITAADLNNDSTPSATGTITYTITKTNIDGTESVVDSGTVEQKPDQNGNINAVATFDKISESGTYKIYIEDEAGNISDYGIDVDTTLVTGKIAASEAAKRFGISLYVTPLEPVSSEVGVQIELRGGNQEVLSPSNPFSFDGGNTWTSDRVIKVTENQTVHIKIKDNFNNIPENDIYTYTIKNIDSADPTFNAIPSEKGDSFHIISDDEGSGIKEISYTYTDLNGVTSEKKIIKICADGTPHDESDLDIGNKGKYVITVTDRAGRFCTQSYDITSIISSNGLFAGSAEDIANNIRNLMSAEPNNDEWTNKDVLISFNPTDTSGFANQPYSWDGGATWTNKPYTKSDGNGDYKLMIMDKYGNKYESGPLAVTNIDSVLPTISATVTNKLVTIIASDENSKIQRIGYTIAGKATETTLATYNIEDAPAYISGNFEPEEVGTYKIFAYDQAGNKGVFELEIGKENVVNAEEKSKDTMTYDELIDWLKSQGIDTDKYADCLKKLYDSGYDFSDIDALKDLLASLGSKSKNTMSYEDLLTWLKSQGIDTDKYADYLKKLYDSGYDFSDIEALKKLLSTVGVTNKNTMSYDELLAWLKVHGIDTDKYGSVIKNLYDSGYDFSDIEALRKLLESTNKATATSTTPTQSSSKSSKNSGADISSLLAMLNSDSGSGSSGSNTTRSSGGSGSSYSLGSSAGGVTLTSKALTPATSSGSNTTPKSGSTMSSLDKYNSLIDLLDSSLDDTSELNSKPLEASETSETKVAEFSIDNPIAAQEPSIGDIIESKEPENLIVLPDDDPEELQGNVAQEEIDTVNTKKKSGLGFIIGIIALLLIGAAGFVWWFFNKRNASTSNEDDLDDWADEDEELEPSEEESEELEPSDETETEETEDYSNEEFEDDMED